MKSRDNSQGTAKSVPVEHHATHTQHYSGQAVVGDAVDNASLRRYDHRTQLNVPFFDWVADSSPKYYPTPQEHRDQVSALQVHIQPCANSRVDSRSDGSRSLAEADKPSTNGTSHPAPVSLLGSGDWESEPDNQFDHEYLPSREFRRLDRRRLRLITGQLNLRQSRKVLRRQRDSIAEQQIQLLQELRVVVFKGGKRDLDNLLEKIQAIQALLETLQTHEEEYDWKEKLLIDDEWKFRDAEEKLLYKHHPLGRKRSMDYTE
jgi:hypothetical protein